MPPTAFGASEPPLPQGQTRVGELILDARRAVFLPNHGILAVADLHLGYPWIQRRRGALLPVEAMDDTVDRLEAIQRTFSPARLVVLGDVVHQATPIPALMTVLRQLCERLAPASELIFCLGNHDRKLGPLISEEGLPARVVEMWSAGNWRLLHGEQPIFELGCPELTGEAKVLMGHEHPCVRLGDGVATRIKAPCFLVSNQMVILPAFSSWSAGSAIGDRPFLSGRAREAQFNSVHACMGARLLAIPWKLACNSGKR